MFSCSNKSRELCPKQTQVFEWAFARIVFLFFANVRRIRLQPDWPRPGRRRLGSQRFQTETIRSRPTPPEIGKTASLEFVAPTGLGAGLPPGATVSFSFRRDCTFSPAGTFVMHWLRRDIGGKKPCSGIKTARVAAVLPPPPPRVNIMPSCLQLSQDCAARVRPSQKQQDTTDTGNRHRLWAEMVDDGAEPLAPRVRT